MGGAGLQLGQVGPNLGQLLPQQAAIEFTMADIGIYMAVLFAQLFFGRRDTFLLIFIDFYRPAYQKMVWGNGALSTQGVGLIKG